MLNNQKGMALIIVFIMTTVIVLIGGAALSLGSTVRKNAVMEVHQSRAYYAAEAGVEKALAEAKHNYAWLKTTVPLKPGDFYPADDEKCLFSDNSHYPDAGDESVIESLRVIKTAEDTKNNTVDLRIQSIGRSFQSRKTITVDAKMYCAYPELFFRGLWTDEMSTLPKGHGVNFQISTFVSTEGLTIPSDSDIAGNVLCNGNAIFQDSNTNKGIIMSGDIISTGNVYLGDKMNLTGTIYINTDHIVSFGSNVTLNGQIVVPGTTDLTGQVVQLSPKDILDKMPPTVPDPLTADRLNWYKDNAGFTSLPPKIDNKYSFQNGIYYIEPPGGKLSLEGTYTGQATLIVNGIVSFTGNMTRTSASDCLVILATGAIETINATDHLEGFFYSKTNLSIKNGTSITGGVTTKKIDRASGNIVSIKENSDMLNAYKTALMNTTNSIQIIKWVQ